MKSCPVCQGELAHEEKTKHPISGEMEINFIFKCGKKVRLVQRGNSWTPIQLTRCEKLEGKKK